MEHCAEFKGSLNTIAACRAQGRTAVERTAAALERARARGGREALNCVAELDPTALEQARALDAAGRPEDAPLWGVPVLVKDNIDVKGLHTTAGSLALADNLAAADAPLVRNLRRSGAVILGKANMTEFANYTTIGMPGGYSSRGGQVVHAIDPALNPSGSSSGSAVAVSAGIVPVAVGSDTSFSIIGCAQTNGICGLKPPIGALSGQGVVPIAHTLDSAGPMAACFADALSLYSALRDEPLPALAPAPLAGLKIAVNTADREQMPSGQAAFQEDVLARLRREGAQIGELCQGTVPEMETLMRWEFKAHLEEYLGASQASLKTLAEIVAFYEAHPETMLKYGDVLLTEALSAPGGLQGREYLDALQKRAAMIPEVTRAIADYDAVLLTGDTDVMHFCGLPSATVAGAQKDEHGVRRCLILYGADELRLYRAALALEAIL